MATRRSRRVLPRLAARDFTSRAGLMWPPRSLDVARILAAAGRPRPRILDHGAGSGLLAALLAPHAEVIAFDPEPSPHAGRFHPVTLEAPDEPFDLVVSSWMEAGLDLRADVARRAPRIVSIFDAEGGCGVKGNLDYSGFGLVEATRWTGPSFEDVEEALARRGRGMETRERNVFAVWTRPVEAATTAARVAAATGGAPFPWEPELAEIGFRRLSA